MSHNIDLHLLNTFTSLLNNLSSVVFWICSADYKHKINISQGFEDIWGRPVEWQLIANPSDWFNTLVIEDLENNLSEFRNRSNNLGKSIIKMRIQRPNGDIRYLKNTSFTIPDSSGKPSIIVGIDELVCSNEWYKMSVVAEMDSFKSCIISELFNNLQKKIDVITPQPTNKAKNLHVVQIENRSFSFTEREKQCINYLLNGLSAKQTASRLDISQRTVEIYLHNIKKKTDSKSKLILLSKLQHITF
jgi:DNA-binding CsgD family transcriptional regulator